MNTGNMAVLAKTYKKNGGGAQTDSGQALMEMLRGQTMEQAKKNLAKVGVKGDAAGNLLAAANNANMLAASVNGVAQSSGLLGKVSAAFTKIKTAAMGAWAAIGPVGKAVVLLSAAAGAFYLIMTKHNRELKKQVKLGEEAQEKNDDTYKSLKSTKDSVKSLAQQYNKSGKAIKTHADSVEALADTYTELHKKVNNVTNENSTLSDDDYQDYLSISNQLANTYPELVKGYDSQGNAILNLGNNAEEAASKLKDLYSAQQMNANIELSSNIQDIANGVLAANELIDKTVDKLDGKLKLLNQTKEAIESKVNANTTLSGIESGQSKSFLIEPENLADPLAPMSQIWTYLQSELKGLANVEWDEDPETGEPTGKLLITWDTDNYDDLLKIKDVIGEQLENTGRKDFDTLLEQESTNQDKINTTIKEQEAQQLKKESNYKSLLSYLNQVLQTNSLFTDLNDDIQSAMASNFSSMDYTGLADFLDSHKGDDDAANQYLYENFIVPIKHMSEEAQDILSEAIQLNPDEFSLSDYSKKIKETLQKVFPDDQETQDLFSQALGFDSIIKESSQTYDKLEKMWRGAGQEIRKMTGEEAEFVLKAKIDQPEASLQELRLKYAQEKKEIENNPIDIKARPNYDAYQTAKENASQGEHYDNMTSALSDFKEAYEQGKKGTDVYKTYAQYLTPYGTFDDASVEKALEKTERYFTEEPADGMINFMNDLTNTYAKNGKALAELDQATGEYKITIDDFEEAAKQMGMGKDWFLDMFDKAEEYGGTFDFFTTEETGLAKLKSLYQGLSTEQQKLFELQQDGADMSAINAQQDIIDGYTERIQNAEKSLDSYYEGAAERIVAETKAGYSGLDLLLKERNKLNNDSSLSAQTKFSATSELDSLIKDQANTLGIDLGNATGEELIQIVTEAVQAADLSPISDSMRQSITEGLKKDDPEIQSALDTLKNYTSEELGQITFGDGSYDENFGEAEKAIDTIAEKLGLGQEAAQAIVQVLKEIGLINVDVEAQDPEEPIRQVQVIADGQPIELETVYKETRLQPQFQTETQQEVQAPLASNVVETKKSTVVIDANNDEANKKIDEVVQNADDQSPITMEIGGDNSEAKKATDQATSYVRGQHPNIDVGADTTRMDAEIDEALKKQHQIEVIANVVASTGGTGSKSANGQVTRAFGTPVVTHAHAAGTNGKLQHDETALVNEEAPEGIVRHGIFSILPGGAHFEKLKRGDIIFNAKQTEELMSSGEVRSNGGRAAYAKGTASKKQVRALSLAYQKEARLARKAGIDISNPQTIFGNINTNKRQVLKWNNSNLKKYKNAIKSWGDDPNDLKGSISTVYGGSNNFNGLEIAYSPILQTKKGAKLLSRGTVFNYINSLMDAANTKYPNSWTTEQFLKLDKKGLKIDGQTIKGLVADVGDTAIQTGEAMHYTGKLGSLNQSYNELYKADPKTAKKIKKQLAKKGKSRAEGSWGEPRNTKALTGELGPEMVVRKNRFFTVGDNGPEFADLQKGDIVFNADQTRELLSRGYTTTRGKALAEGNARWGGAQNGSLQLIRGNSGTGTTAPSSDPTAAEEANTNAVNENTSATSSNTNSANESKQAFDWIQNAITAASNRLEMFSKAITDWTSTARQAILLNKEILEARNNMRVNSKAADAYANLMNQSTLDNSYKEKVRNGEMPIETINTSTGNDAVDTQNKKLIEEIQNYQDLYTKYVACIQAVREYSNQQGELFNQKLQNRIDSCNNKIDQFNNKLTNTSKAYELLTTNANKFVKAVLAKTEEGKKIVDAFTKVEDTKSKSTRKSEANYFSSIDAREQASNSRKKAGSNLVSNRNYKWTKQQKTDIKAGKVIDTTGLKGKQQKAVKSYNKKVLAEQTAVANIATSKNKMMQSGRNDSTNATVAVINHGVDQEVRTKRSIMNTAQSVYKKNDATYQKANKTYQKVNTTTKNMGKDLSQKYASELTKGQKSNLSKGLEIDLSGIDPTSQKYKDLKKWNSQVYKRDRANDKRNSAKEARNTSRETFESSANDYAESRANAATQKLQNSSDAYSSKRDLNSATMSNQEAKLTNSKKISAKSYNSLINTSALDAADAKADADNYEKIMKQQIKSGKLTGKAKEEAQTELKNKRAAQKEAEEKNLQYKISAQQATLDHQSQLSQRAQNKITTGQNALELKKDQGKKINASDYKSMQQGAKEDIVAQKSQISTLQKMQSLVKRGSEEWRDYENQIASANQQIQSQQKYLEEINDELDQMKIDNLQFNIDQTQRENKKRENARAEKQAKGFELTEDDYVGMIKDSQAEQVSQENLRAELLRQQVGKEVGSDEWKSLQEQIDSCDDSIAKAKQNQIEYNNDLNNLPLNRLKSQLEILDATGEALSSVNDLKTARGEDLSVEDYNNQMQNNLDKVENDTNQRNIAYKKYLQAIAEGGAIDGRTAEQWQKEYLNLDASINQTLTENEQLKKSLRDDVYWRDFERAHTATQRLANNIKGIGNLISDDALFDPDTGTITDMGYAKMATDLKQFEQAREEVENYSNDIANLRDLYAKGEYTQEDFNAKLAELQQGLLDSAADMKTLEEAVIDFYKQAGQAQLDALFELIDLRKKDLDRQKEAYNWAKQVKNNNKELQNLDAQIAAYESLGEAADDATKAKLAQLKAERQDKQDEVDDALKEHTFELSSQGLDDMKENLQDAFDKSMKNISGDLDKITEIMIEANKVADANASNTVAAINKLLSHYGINPVSTGVTANTGFSTGGIIRDAQGSIQANGDNTIVRVNPGETILTQDFTKLLPDTVSVMKNFVNDLTPVPSSLPLKETQSPIVQISYDSLLTVNGDVDKDVWPGMQKMLEKSYEYVGQKMMRDLGVKKKF